jgi:hypothetical protein
MGWWSTEKDNEVIGDIPVDIVTTALQALAKSHEEIGKPKLTLAELLGGMTLILQQKSEDYLDDGSGIHLQKIVAKGNHQFNQEITQESDQNVLQVIDQALNEIVSVYENTLERKPRLGEILACFAFVLAYEPERYLSKLGGASIEDFISECGPPML